jgi:ABC-2 type transport system ATP-binding protein
VRNIIAGLRDEGTAVFLNSHFLSEIELTCDRVAFIREGRVLRVAPLAELEQESLRVRLRVGRPGPELLAGLARFGSEPVAGRAHTGVITLHLTSEATLPEMVRWLVEGGHELYELSPQRLSLEERFIQIVGEDVREG